jgi:hypothetical protein
MAYYEIASTETAQLLLGEGGSKLPAVATPGGVVHAVNPEAPHETVCGISTDALRLWRLPWYVDDEVLNHCAACTVLITSVTGA